MSVFKRRGGAYVSKFSIDGEQHWTPGSPWPTRRQAQEAERRYRDKLRARVTDETCASFAERWLEEWPRPAEGTNRTYAAAAKRFAEAFGPTHLGEVERISARAWALTVPRGVSRVVGIMYEDARNIGLVEVNPFSNLRLPQSERKREIVPPTPAELERLLDGCFTLGGYRDEFQSLIRFAAWTGLRSGELQALRWPNVGEDMIRVDASRRRDGGLGPPKNGKPRTVIYPPPARLPVDHPRRDTDDFVFHAPQGGPLVYGSLSYAWRAVRASAGLERIRWHDLRHHCATQLLEMGMSHFDVSVQLGHEDNGQLVIECYGHPSKDAALARLQAAFEPGVGQIGSWATARGDV